MSTVYLYVIGRERGPVKIGVSVSPNARLAQLQTGCPFQCELLHAEPLSNREEALFHEHEFHEICATKRLSGEWFKMDFDAAKEVIETGVQLDDYFGRAA
jgi:predicted GIY-YIG superfamily endonuclease